MVVEAQQRNKEARRFVDIGEEALPELLDVAIQHVACLALLLEHRGLDRHLSVSERNELPLAFLLVALSLIIYTIE